MKVPPLLDGVAATLNELNLGSLDPESVVELPGRNDNVSGVTDTGRAVFVKRLTGEDSERRLRQLITFETAYRERLRQGTRTPRCLGWSSEHGTVVFEWIEDARSGADLASEGGFGEDLAYDLGRSVGFLHTVPPEGELSGTSLTRKLAEADLFEALPLEYYEQASGGTLEAWRLLHHDPSTAAAVHDLRTMSDQAPRALIHGDLRLDQVLSRRRDVYVCDWEEIAVEDPALDVGAFAGEWLYRSVLEIPSARPAQEDGAAEVHRGIVARGTDALSRTRNRNAAFWQGYLASAGPVHPQLPARAAGYAGLHLLERALAKAEGRVALHTVDRMAIGIGTVALKDPGRFVTALGLG